MQIAEHFKSMVLIAWIATAFVLTQSCGKDRNPTKAGKPYKAVVLDLTSVDANGSPHFGLVERSYFSLDDLDALDGTYLKFLRGGELKVSEVNGSIVSAESFSGGESPNLRYDVSDGVVLAKDYSTLAMLSAYYQFDWIYSEIQKRLGIEPGAISQKIGGGKHTVLFEPQISFDISGAEGSFGLKLNAAFSPQDKKFLLFQRSAVENVPLSGNTQVLTHEFGHFVFDYTFFQSLYDDKNYLGESYALRGLNEGFADFISWTFTGSPDILRASIDIAEIADERHITRSTFVWSDFTAQSISDSVYDNAIDSKKCRDSFYCIGTIFARSLIQTQTSLSGVDKNAFATGIVESLKSTQAAMRNNINTLVALETDGDQPELSWSRQANFVSSFLRELVIKVPDGWKSTMCEKFASNFGSEGFSSIFREGACP